MFYLLRVKPHIRPLVLFNHPRSLILHLKKSKTVCDIKDAANLFSSPTGNLPNIILDGRSPHEKLKARTLCSGQKVKNGKQKIDWLTEMGQQKKNSLPKNKLSKQQHTAIGKNKDDKIYSAQ